MDQVLFRCGADTREKKNVVWGRQTAQHFLLAY